MSAQFTPYLTPEQVHTLNEKYGWFQIADAQSDVSRAFAQDAIEMHERIRAAAPELLAALQAALAEVGGPDGPYSTDSYIPPHLVEMMSAAIEKATGGSQ